MQAAHGCMKEQVWWTCDWSTSVMIFREGASRRASSKGSSARTLTRAWAPPPSSPSGTGMRFICICLPAHPPPLVHALSLLWLLLTALAVAQCFGCWSGLWLLVSDLVVAQCFGCCSVLWSLVSDLVVAQCFGCCSVLWLLVSALAVGQGFGCWSVLWLLLTALVVGQ